MRVALAALVALSSVPTFASPIESEAALEVHPLLERGSSAATINCWNDNQAYRGSTADSNQNAKIVKAYGQKNITFYRWTKIAETNVTLAAVHPNGGSGSSKTTYQVTGDTLGQIIFDINNACGKDGKVAGQGIIPYQDTTITVFVAHSE